MQSNSANREYLSSYAASDLLLLQVLSHCHAWRQPCSACHAGVQPGVVLPARDTGSGHYQLQPYREVQGECRNTH